MAVSILARLQRQSRLRKVDVAESTLSIAYAELISEIGAFLGYGPTSGNWSAAQSAEIARYLKAGIRQYYYPPAMDGVEQGYEWSFLKPTTTIDTIERYTTGSLVVASGTCTLSGGTWPSWAATHGTLVIDGTEYTISSRDGDTQLTVVGDDVTADEDDWYLSHAGYQDLPDSFGRVVSDFYFEPDVYRNSIVITSLAHLLRLRQESLDEAIPQYAAIRPKTSTGSTGQRFEVMWWPIPDDVYTLTYRYEAYQGILTSELPYPLGGMKHSELILESCLAVAELRANDEKGIHWEAFTQLLKTGVAQDRKNGAHFFGHMGMQSDDLVVLRHQNQAASYPVTYKGSTW
jgi:hypothetical protein